MRPVVDRSKLRNPDLQPGHVMPEIKFILEDGMVYGTDGKVFTFAGILYDVELRNGPDYSMYQDLSFLSDSDNDEDISCEQEAVVECTETKECTTVTSTNTKEKKEPPTVKEQLVKSVAEKEPDENVHAEKKSNHEKKNLESNKDSQVDDFLTKMEIEFEKLEKKKKRKKSSKESMDSDSSQSSKKKCRSRSRESQQSVQHKKIVTYSSSLSPSPERYDVHVKSEPIEQPQHLFGSYRCDDCNITMNSKLTYETHIIGRRHLKTMKSKNLPVVIAQSIPVIAISEDDSKYPKTDRGVIRKKVNMTAAIQPTVDVKIGNGPCPGLDKVIEIRGLVNTIYYCAICDCTCASDSLISHLKGFKHHLNSIKYFKPSVYEQIQSEPKYKIEKKVSSILRAVQKREGMGRISVEVDELSSNPEDVHCTSKSSSSTNYKTLPSTSTGICKKQSDMSFTARYHQASIPNASASDFFCELCHSHMNSFQMWEAHINGKRHLTNLKKNPGDLPSKTKTVPVNRRAVILDRIKHECKGEPVIGLKEIRETEIMETRSHSYQCFLCGSCHTSSDIIDHLISLKHRTKYLEHIDFNGREVIAGMSDTAAYSLVRDMCAQVEAVEGHGSPTVHVNKKLLYR